MSDFGNYMKAQDREESAKWLYNYASRNLELAHIYKRAAELKSQHEPLHSLTGDNKELKRVLHILIDYVIGGKKIETTDVSRKG